MDNHNNRQPQLLVELIKQLHNLQLVTDIKISRRLIKQQHLRSLCQRHRYPGALTLAATERVQKAVAHRGHIGLLQGPGNVLRILLVTAAQKAAMRKASHFNQILHRQIRRRNRRLRQNRQTAGKFAVRQAMDILAQETDAALGTRQNAGNSLQRCALAAAVGTDDGSNLALGNCQRQIMDDCFFVNCYINMRCL